MPRVAREAFARGRCLECGGSVMLKISINSRVYYRCGGLVEEDGAPRECGSRHTYGPSESRRMIAQADAATPPEPNDNERANPVEESAPHVEEPAGNPEPEPRKVEKAQTTRSVGKPPRKPAAKRAGKPAGGEPGKPGGGAFSPFDW